MIQYHPTLGPSWRTQERSEKNLNHLLSVVRLDRTGRDTWDKRVLITTPTLPRSVDPAPFLTVNKRMLTFYSETLGRLQASQRFSEDSRGRSCTSHQTVRLRQSSNSFLFVFLLLKRSDRFHVFPVSFFCCVLDIHEGRFSGVSAKQSRIRFQPRQMHNLMYSLVIS